MQQTIELRQGNGQLVEATLCTMQLQHLDDFNIIWRGLLEEMGEEDAFWSWARKKELALNDSCYEAYAVEYGDLTQGLMWIETQ